MSEQTVDGRTARRDRNRMAVLDAVLALFGEGDLDPSPEAVAARAGLSLRSVYRYVTDREDLARAAMALNLERSEPFFALPHIGEGPLPERIERFVASRVRLYDAIGATHRAARLRAPTGPVIRERLAWSRERMREQLEQQFAPELVGVGARKRRDLVAAADVLTQIEGIEHLRMHRAFSSRVTRDILVDGLTRVFGAPAI
jgi:AcrR family transcriptional regulator